MTVREFVADAQKAIRVFALVESAAVGEGLLSQDVAATVTAVLGAAASVLVYFTDNEKPANP